MTEPDAWQIDGEEFLWNPTAEPDVVEPVATEAPVAVDSTAVTPDVSLTPTQILEAMVFVGGAPVTIRQIRDAIRGLSSDEIQAHIRLINSKYDKQNRPYRMQLQADAVCLVIKPQFRALREKLIHSPREVRLSQAALDLLSLIAYRQPISRADLEAVRGGDCGSAIRSLLRTGLISLARRPDSDDRVPVYGTTARFLEHFQLNSLDDLPRLGESQIVS